MTVSLTNTSGRNNTTTLHGIAFDPDSGTAPSVQVYFNEAPADAQFALRRFTIFRTSKCCAARKACFAA